MIVLPVDEKQQLAEQERAATGGIDVQPEWTPRSLDSIEDEYAQEDEPPPPDYNDVPAALLQDFGNIQSDTDALGNVSTSDARVSSDERLMLAFIMHHCSHPPPFYVRISGVGHVERDPSPPYDGARRPCAVVRKHASQSDDDAEAGSSSDSQDDDTRTVVPSSRASPKRGRSSDSEPDFDFRIDLGQNLAIEPEFFVLRDTLAAHRGAPALEVDAPQGRRPAFSVEKEVCRGMRARTRRGDTPWQLRNCGGARPLSDWVRDFVRSGATLKEFSFTRVVHGWDLAAIEAEIRAAVAAAPYNGRIDVCFEPATAESSIVVKSRRLPALPSTLQQLLLRAFSVHRTTVCGAAYSFKRWVYLSDSLRGENVADYVERTGRGKDGHSQNFKQVDEGVSELVGTTERDWVAQWEGTIRRCARAGLRTRNCIQSPA